MTETNAIQQPAAWIVDIGESKVDHIYASRLDAEQKCDWHLMNFPHIKARIVPLYRLPTLTDAEREAISEVVDCLTESGTALANPTTTRNTLAALLARLA